MARKLIELARRKADFDPEHCTPIRLGDGQEWYFPKPWLAIVPEFMDGEAVDYASKTTFGDELDPLLKSIADEGETASKVLNVLTLAAFLLLRNYDLESEDLSRLLIFKAGEDRSEEMLESIVKVATGNLFDSFGVESLEGPKAYAVGSGSA